MKAAILCPGPSLATAVIQNRGYDLLIGVNRAPAIRADVPCDWWCFGDGRVPERTALAYQPRIFCTSHAAKVVMRMVTQWEDTFGRFPAVLGWSNHSALAALVLAASEGATEIDVFGADWSCEPDADGVNWPDNTRTPQRWEFERTLWASLIGELKIPVRRLRCPLYCNYYTVGTAYAEEAAALAGTLGRFALASDIAGRDSRGSWVKNCGQKSDFIAGRLATAKTPICWLDADARVVQYPALFDELHERCDFAAHWLRDELISSTLYFNDTPAARKLADDWTAECEANPGEWDQRALQRLVEGRAGLRVERLPAVYCWLDGGEKPDISEKTYGKREPTIIQTQASRRLRRAAG